tara:strand:- start:180 stop:611 length:432 start_codon:yes stop_codon:yes gene_type:complete
VATSYITDSGTAVPLANVLKIQTAGAGTKGITTSSTGDNLVTVTLTAVVPTYVSVTGPITYDVTATDYFISCNASGGLVTIRLLNAPVNLYDQFIVKDRTGFANIVVTTVGGAVLIDGTTSQTFIDPYESLELLWNGTSYETF